MDMRYIWLLKKLEILQREEAGKSILVVFQDFKGFFELPCHIIERLSQLSDFIGSVKVNGFIPFSFGDVFGCKVEPDERFCDPPSGENANDDRYNQRCYTQQDSGAGVGVDLLHQVRLWNNHHNQPVQPILVSKGRHLKELPLTFQHKFELIVSLDFFQVPEAIA